MCTVYTSRSQTDLFLLKSKKRKKMKFNTYVLIDEFPDNDEVELCIFTRPKYPVQYRDQWNKDVKFACSPSAINVFRLLGIKETFPIEENYNVNGQKFHVRCIEYDSFGSYMLIIQCMDEMNEMILYTGQFTTFSSALRNSLANYLENKFSDMYIDNELAFTGHTNSLKSACNSVQYYLRKYEGYRVYLDLEDLFGYEELLINLAQERKIKIRLHKLQMAIMRHGNNLQYFDFEGNPDLKVFYRPERNNWNLEHYERFFIESKCVYLKFIGTQNNIQIDTENVYYRFSKSGERETIKSEFKGFHYIAYSPHPTKHTLANFIRLVEPLRIYPLYLPQRIDYEWSNIIPNDIIPNSSKLVTPDVPESESESESETEPFLTDSNGTFRLIQNNATMENEQEDFESLCDSILSHHSSIQNDNPRNIENGSTGKSFLALSSDEYESDDDVARSAENMSSKEQTKSPPRTLHVEPIVISDDDSCDFVVQLASRRVDIEKKLSVDIMSVDSSIFNESKTDHCRNRQTENESQPVEKLNVITTQIEKENRVNEVNNNGHALDEDIKIAQAHCHNKNQPTQATQLTQSNSTQPRLKNNKKKCIPLISQNRQKVQYLPETDDESEDDNDAVLSSNSSSDTSSNLSPLKFE